MVRIVVTGLGNGKVAVWVNGHMTLQGQAIELIVNEDCTMENSDRSRAALGTNSLGSDAVSRSITRGME